MDVSGNAHADGTSDGNWWIDSDGHKYRDIQPGDHGYDLVQAGQLLIDKWKASGEDFISNAYFTGQKQMEKWAKDITNNTAISNITNNRNMQPVINGGINITCPGITSQEVARQVGVELNNMFQGFHNFADQQSRKR